MTKLNIGSNSLPTSCNLILLSTQHSGPWNTKASKCPQRPAPATAYMAWVPADSSRLTPPANAEGATPSIKALCALATATRPELQAVSMARHGPHSPKTYEIRPARIPSLLVLW